MNFTTTPVRRAAAVAAMAVATTALLAGCGGGKKPATIAAPPTPTPKAVQPWRSPFTGLTAGQGKRILVVKIDNTAPSHPQVGIGKADIGYIEEVEGGLTRIAAVFSSKLPKTVGPVRSARETDIELFAQYGKVAFAYSGAQPAVTRELQAANLFLEEDGYGSGWFRGYGRPAPYNLFATPKELLAARPQSAKVHDVGFRFGSPVSWMRRTGGFSVTYPGATVTWQWSAAKKRFLLSMGGVPSMTTDGGQVSADNVIVQYVDVFASRLHDVNGMHTPFSKTVGKGNALFLRNGKLVTGTWSRANKKAPTIWRVGKSARRYPMQTGKTWIVLVPKGMRVHRIAAHA